jgi:hypothetical protein
MKWLATLVNSQCIPLKIISTNTNIGLNANIDINMAISKSPDRHTFQKEQYIKRCAEEGVEPDEGYLNLYKSSQQRDEENMSDPEWKKDNMEYDLRSTDWILEKVRASDVYAQNLYAAICNNDFQKLEVIPILSNKTWSASWRSAGGIVAHMRQEGDYIDWYCSGIRDIDAEPNGYVTEMVVTDEIREDLKRLGWVVIDQNNEF